MGQPQQDRSCLEWQEAKARLPGTARAHLCKTAVFNEPRLWLYEIAELGPQLPQAGDAEAGHLLDVIRIQSVTRREAKKAVLSENPLVDETAQELLSKITELQGTDPLCTRLKKELVSSQNGHSRL